MAAYAWFKCEREEDKECYTVLKEAGIIGREGNLYGAETSYVRLSLLKSQDDFDALLHQINKLVAQEDGTKSIIWSIHQASVDYKLMTYLAINYLGVIRVAMSIVLTKTSKLLFL